MANPEELKKIAEEETARGIGLEAGASGRLIDYGQYALTNSENLMKWIKGQLQDPESKEINQILTRFYPYIDRLTVTNYYNEKEAREAKLFLRSEIIRTKLELDEDDINPHIELHILESTIRGLINSNIDGYRGKLATEKRTTTVAKFESTGGGRRKLFGVI